MTGQSTSIEYHTCHSQAQVFLAVGEKLHAPVGHIGAVPDGDGGPLLPIALRQANLY